MPRWTSYILFLLLPGIAFADADFDEDASDSPLRPLWEIGLFNGLASIPHYRGSDQSDEYGLVLPYFIYRGQFLESDRDGFRGVLYKQRQIKSTVSLSVKPPVDEDNDAREGMDDLEPLFELGPALEIDLWRNDGQRLYLKTEFRAVAEVDGPDVQHIGWRGRQRLIWRHRNFMGSKKLQLGLNANLEWASSEYHAYFYRVNGEDTTPDRPRYSTSSGYAGVSFSANLFYRITPRFSVGGFTRWDYLGGAVFEDSPLVEQNDVYTVGIAAIVKLFESKRFEWKEP